MKKMYCPDCQRPVRLKRFTKYTWLWMLVISVFFLGFIGIFFLVPIVWFFRKERCAFCENTDLEPYHGRVKIEPPVDLTTRGDFFAKPKESPRLKGPDLFRNKYQ